MKDNAPGSTIQPHHQPVWRYERGELVQADSEVSQIAASVDEHGCPRGYHLQDRYGADSQIEIYEKHDLPGSPKNGPRWIIDVCPFSSRVETIIVDGVLNLAKLLLELRPILELPNVAESIQRPELYARDEKARQYRLSNRRA